MVSRCLHLYSKGTLLGIAFVLFAAISTEANPPKDLMIYLNFDEGRGNSAKDQSKNKYVGELMEGAKWSKEGAPNFGGGVQMNGGSSHVAINKFSTEVLKASNEITIGAWFKSIEHDQWDGVVSIELDVAGCCEFRIMIHPSMATFWNMGRHKDRIGKFKFEAKKWYHYAMTYDGKTAEIFANAKKVDESVEGIKLPSAKGVFYVGTGEKPGTWAMEKGIIDEVFAFSRRLKANELKDVMEKGAIPKAVEAKNKLTTSWGNLKVYRL